MTIEQYINLRDSGKEVENIKEEFLLSEATVLTFELGYTCYLNKVSLDSAIDFMSKTVLFDPSKCSTTTFNPFN